MPVILKGRLAPRPRTGRGLAFDRQVHAHAELFLKHQAVGHVNSRELAVSLNAAGVPSPRGGAWVHKTVYRILERGVELGIPFKLIELLPVPWTPR